MDDGRDDVRRVVLVDLDDELAEVPDVEEKRGLLGRLIGRDLSDNEDDAPERVDPPLEAAPMPRVEPRDRITPVVPALPVSEGSISA